MILESFGVLSEAQDITEADEISENVILMAAIDYTAITDLWWVVDTNVAAVTTGTLKFELVIATAAALGTAIQICCVDLADVTDVRSATAGRHIAAFNVGNQVVNMLTTAGSDYPYLGQKNTLGAGVTISINAALSTGKPPTEFNQQVIRSNVTVPS